ncbi:MAG: glutamine--fructose-6-phosphate transaminase (isomerizing) [Rickettsiales bacterium]|jgi:glucosamine--fructose-6-phosphate aminotransferase (isomerizing)|nr:glutamine--fructose-6-phosphate transaminase (isomerizing) [Rickettsiales bacterium]
MCGIAGVVSKKGGKVKSVLIKLIKQLEYRGYDSCGILLLKDGQFLSRKTVGKVKDLEEKIGDLEDSNIGIAHTRWATHGVVNEENSHPHVSCHGNVALIHNGIIENYGKIKSKLSAENFIFMGQSDSEIFCNLFDYNFPKGGDFRKAFFKTLREAEGSYAIAVIHRDSNKIFVAKNKSPLFLGITKDSLLVASSVVAFSGITNRIVSLQDGEKAILSETGYKVFDKDDREIKKEEEEIEIDDGGITKGNYSHFMLKEIYEQPDVLKRTVKEYIDGDRIIFPKFNFDLGDTKFLTIVACGTSYYAGCVAKYFIEELADVFVNVEIASEFIYKNNPMPKNGLALFISQSGETADTIAALKYCKDKGQKIVGVVNVLQSAIAKMSDIALKTMAGIEIGVASTKAFTGQVSVLYLFALEMAKQNGNLSEKDFKEKLNDFKNSYQILEKTLGEKIVDNIKAISGEMAKANNLFYVGRNIFYPMALEGALKIKEVSYIATQGVASGELKHGPIALIDSSSFVVALNNSKILCEKNMSTIEEINARHGKIILICDKIKGIDDKAHIQIETPAAENKFDILLSTIPVVQLLAFYTALNRGVDIDKPRNLAKSVTVE